MTPAENRETLRTLPEMLRRTVTRFPEREAYRQYDYANERWISLTWRGFAQAVLAWRRSFAAMGLKRGERVAMHLTNSIEAAAFDQAALASALVPVPLHAVDTAGSSAFILQDSGARFLVTTSSARWNAVLGAAGSEGFPDLAAVVIVNETFETHELELPGGGHARIMDLEHWIGSGRGFEGDLGAGPGPDDPAGFIYTSGTTGRSKGVILTHRNITENLRQVEKALDYMPISEEDVFLSFLPLSHTFERTYSYYNAVYHGALLVFSRGVGTIERDMAEVRPTVMISVPRIYEMLYSKIRQRFAEEGPETVKRADWLQEIGWRRFCEANGLPVENSPRSPLDKTAWPGLDADIGQRVRDVFGGRLRFTVAGGASISYSLAKFFLSRGVNLIQGYGLTETSPVVTATRFGENHPDCVGHPVPGTEVKLGENDELLVRGPQVMKGYWNRPEATAEAMRGGWFHTGDKADISESGRIRIKGRIKEIIVTSTGEKIAPVDVELAITHDPLFEQALVIGDNRPFVVALVVVNEYEWKKLCEGLGFDPADPATAQEHSVQRACQRRVRAACREFPQYGVPRLLAVMHDHWTVENGLLTPTMKLKRAKIISAYASTVEGLYAQAH